MSNSARYPNLFIAGAPKCGTTSLANWLGEHPDIFAPITKEPVLFATDLTSALPIDPAARAARHFRSWGTQPFALDATTHYFFSERAPSEMAARCSDPRVYLLVRNPADAVHSVYHQLRFNGAETLPTLEEALDAETERAASLKPIRFGFPEYLLYSRIYAYSENIPRFERALGPSRIRVILFEDLVANPYAVTRSIFEDLDVDPAIARQIRYSAKNTAKRSRARRIHQLAVYPPPWVRTMAKPLLSGDARSRLREWVTRINTVPHKNPPLSPETRRRLNEQFRPHVEWLSEYLGRDLSHWTECRDITSRSVA